MNIIIALVTAATLWPAGLSAAEGERERKWKIDIVGCVQEVRNANRSVGGFERSNFDAYATPGLRVKYFGTQREIFQFEKCMAERGHYIDKQ